MKYAKIGTVSHATVRNEDLIPAFCYELEYHAKQNNNQGHLALVEEIRDRMGKPGYYDSDDADYDLNEDLFDALNEYAPEGCYFGSHPGNGSDYGFWEHEDYDDNDD